MQLRAVSRGIKLMTTENLNPVLWTPSATHLATTGMSEFTDYLHNRRLTSADFAQDYAALHAWSVTESEAFWSAVWDFTGVIGERGETVLRDGHLMPGATWFPDAQLNYAENVLRPQDVCEALVFWGEDKVKTRLTHAELFARVAHMAAALRSAGVGQGDRVAAYMPNTPHTLIAMLAAASLGAIFTSASPDFGVQGVLDRFGQSAPKVLIATDGYYYAGKTIDTLAKLPEIVAGLPGLQTLVVAPYVAPDADVSGINKAQRWDDFVAPFGDVQTIDFVRLPFAHPLFIMYSSGTTGVPKCIVHSAGGALLQHIKEHRLHGDVRAGDRLFYFTTCGWMMWNWLATGLASGATLLLYDGSPFVDEGRLLFDYAEAERMTHFGTSAKFIDALAKTPLKPIDRYDLSALRVMFSTGSPLVAEAFDYVYSTIKTDLQLASISGGTDILSCFVLGNPNAPVRRGEIQCAGLGMAVDVVDDAGEPLRGDKGELVCKRSFPVMPVGFWNDADGAKYHAAYFERFDNIWCHGDFAEITENGGFVIYGRSDATLNPGGVRIGTAEIYRQVERLPEVLESIVIGQDWPPAPPGQASGDVRVVLFVKLREGLTLDDALDKRIKATIRDNTTPRHVPACIVQVSDIPRTKSGKIVELAVRNVVHGLPVKNREALANPEALAHYQDRAELQQ
jgi:acetoacetyl-CoA synthetase